MSNFQDGSEVNQKVKLSCKQVWKVFGHNADSLFKPQQEIDPALFEKDGFIKAVCNANFEVYENEIFIIMGLSGSGKSTLLRCMTRLIEPSFGSILFEDKDLMQVSESELIQLRRHKMGMVFQHFALLPNRTVLSNVELPLEVHGVPKDTRQAKAKEVISLVGLQGREDYYPRELSGGQQQRVGIARSLVAEPDVWFLDEPFSALDPLIRREMQDEFIRLQSMLSKTIVFITHDFDEAIRLADRIAIMKDGEIIQIGTPEELVLNPATDYVEEFTQGIPRTKVLTASSVMTPAQSKNYKDNVKADVILEELLGQILNAEKDDSFAVQNNQGEVIGELSRKTVVDLVSTKYQKI